MLDQFSMNKRIVDITNWLADQLTRLAIFLRNAGRPPVIQSKFVNLAPTDQADKGGVYSEALLFATADPQVSNIALTGPYGSGKSSIIQSFLKEYRKPTLHISLAAFIPETGAAGDKVGRQEIERSILQQMLYGADANKLPLSRFKRIQSPGVFSIVNSLLIMLGLLSLWFVFLKRAEIVSGSFFSPLMQSNWPNYAIMAFAFLFLWRTLHHFYVASFGVSLKSISLKDIEIRPSSDNQESILNRHLDEIIYFFQATDYDLVIIEDLDRFDNAEIFVTLREINSLINENAGVKRTIRFLYALRDDIFVNTDRTKFFEFIIPVIPIINTSNSIDMVLEQGKRLALDGRLDRQFLREVSRYLNDLRLIQNIFNEYAIYVANLETDNENILDANKLLAILIYKNVYPRDFEQLHRGEGNLADILGRHDELTAYGESACKAEIAELEQRIALAERQIPSDLKELRQIYTMALIERLPEHVTSVSADGQSWTPLHQLVDNDAFERLIEAPRLRHRIVHNYSGQLDLSNLQSEVNSQKTYLQRKEEITDKADTNKNEILRRIQELRAKITTIRATKFNDLVRSSADRTPDLFNGFGEKGNLARFLVLEGHLDDTYYQYTSLFHSGRLSPNDNKFLIQIRAFATPDPAFPIDNPKEVIAAMRDEDFGQSYVLNVKLIDCLLSDTTRYSDQTRRYFEFIASNFNDCEDFLEAYYTTGRCVSRLLSGLTSTWKLFIPTAIASKHNLSHISQLVANLPESALAARASDGNELPEFVAANLPEILALTPDLAPERLDCIGFEIRDVPAIGAHTGIVHFMVKRGHFELSIANLEHIYSEVLGETNFTAFRERNYSTLRSIADSAILARIERDFDFYLRNVLLELNDNIHEDSAAIVDILSREKIDIENVQQFLARQTTVLPTLNAVPEALRPIVFQLRRIDPTWENCITFMQSEAFDEDTLTAYLEHRDVRSKILKRPISNDSETLQVRQFLLRAEHLSDEAYREYIRILPNKWKTFPNELTLSKLTVLIQERVISFSKDSLDSLDGETHLPEIFVTENIASYIESPETFCLDDEFHERLLQGNISDGQKRAIIDLMDLSTLAELPQRSSLIGPILDRTSVNISGMDAAQARSIVTNSAPIETQVSLFNKLQTTMTKNEVCQTLATLAKPYSEISRGYHTPRLPPSDKNRELVEWLKSRGIISSWSEGGTWFSSNEIRVNLKRPYQNGS